MRRDCESAAFWRLKGSLSSGRISADRVSLTLFLLLHVQLEGILKRWSSESANYFTNGNAWVQNVLRPWLRCILVPFRCHSTLRSGNTFLKSAGLEKLSETLQGLDYLLERTIPGLTAWGRNS